MIMLLKFLGTIAITLITYGVQKYLSTRRVWQLGAVVPLLSIATLIILYFFMQVSQTEKYIVVSAFLLALELLIWIDGRHQYRKEELMKMKAKDIN
jgi:glycerol-3-phosphate acyltransferase PlsY